MKEALVHVAVEAICPQLLSLPSLSPPADLMFMSANDCKIAWNRFLGTLNLQQRGGFLW